jgi:hypothetical protein
MPRHYRLVVTMYDEDDQQVATSTHEEIYEDDQEAKQRFEQKEKAARGAGKGKGKG